MENSFGEQEEKNWCVMVVSQKVRPREQAEQSRNMRENERLFA